MSTSHTQTLSSVLRYTIAHHTHTPHTHTHTHTLSLSLSLSHTQNTHTHTHTHSLSLSLSLALSHTHNTHTPHTHTHTLSLSLSLSLSHTHTHTHTHTPLSLSRSLTHKHHTPHTHTLSLSLALSHTHHTHTPHTHTHTHTPTHTNTHITSWEHHAHSGPRLRQSSHVEMRDDKHRLSAEHRNRDIYTWMSECSAPQRAFVSNTDLVRTEQHCLERNCLRKMNKSQHWMSTSIRILIARSENKHLDKIVDINVHLVWFQLVFKGGYHCCSWSGWETSWQIN